MVDEMNDRGDEKPSPELEKTADKLRRTAEAEAKRAPQQGGSSHATATIDSTSAEVADTLRKPELSKGRPGASSKHQPTNAGNGGA
jgi:hypothetical protein